MSESNDYNVKLLNEAGEVVGTKLRSEINKAEDILHTVHTIGITANKEVILSLIPQKKQIFRDGLFEGKLGNAAAAIVREDESAEDAAKRALSDELFLTNIEVQLLGEEFDVMEREDGSTSRRLHTAYMYKHFGANVCFNRNDSAGLLLFQREDLDAWVNEQPDLFAPSFVAIWQRYHHLLAV